MLRIKSCAGAERLIFLCWASRHGSRSTKIAVKDARIVLGGIAPSPVEIKEAANALIGNPLAEDQSKLPPKQRTSTRPLDNTDFVYQWRKQMARQYTLRALRDLQT